MYSAEEAETGNKTAADGFIRAGNQSSSHAIKMQHRTPKPSWPDTGTQLGKAEKATAGTTADDVIRRGKQSSSHAIKMQLEQDAMEQAEAVVCTGASQTVKR